MFTNLIFTGKVRHRRFKPQKHQFSYKLYMFCIELGNIENSLKKAKYISLDKFGLLSFYRKNYLKNNGNIEAKARELVVEKFKIYPEGKIYLLTNLTCLGYCFNPISIYFIFDKKQQQVEYLILEVTNTPWGERHNYVLQNSTNPQNIYQHEFPKTMHVSPFLAMDYQYMFNLKISNEQIAVHMENIKNDDKHFDATLNLQACNDKQAPNIIRRKPFMTLKVITLIYWQALLLFFKRVPFHTHPRKKGKQSDAK